jgi:hypothetical protein
MCNWFSLLILIIIEWCLICTLHRKKGGVINLNTVTPTDRSIFVDYIQLKRFKNAVDEHGCPQCMQRYIYMNIPGTEYRFGIIREQ